MGGGGYSSPVQYVLKLEQFVVAQTRSGDKDTAVVAFRAQVGDLLYPLQTKRIENVHNGGTYVINLEIGPILAPINTPVTFFYSIVNSGYDTSDTNVARQLADGLSDLAAGFCTLVFGQGAVWDKLNELTKKINKSGFVNCDGPVAAGGQPVAIDILDQWTPNGLYRQSDHFVRPTSATSPPCHGQSDYTVSWSVEAKRAILDLPAIASDGHLSTPGHKCVAPSARREASLCSSCSMV